MKKLTMLLASDENYARVLMWSTIVVGVYAICLAVVILTEVLKR
jgi:hypothetical protein